MANLTIYDSQGTPIRDETGGRGDTVSDLFFDGVRFAIDSRRQEAVCFFRAKDNPTARSEQYYAVYEYESRSELARLVEAVRSRIEEEYGMHLDTTNDDTRFFELLEGGGSATPPGDPSTLDDLEEIIEDYHQAKVGVGDYRDALGLFSKFHGTLAVSGIAVADNASGTSLSSYDLVVETGNYTGLEPLGDTASRMEDLRERRRRELGYDVPDDDGLLDGLTPVEGALLFGGAGVLLVIAALYGSCLGLHAAPLGGALPGPSCGPSIDGVDGTLTFAGDPTMNVTGQFSGGGTNAVVATVTGPNDGTARTNANINGSGQFAIEVPLTGDRSDGSNGTNGTATDATTAGGTANASADGPQGIARRNGTLPAGIYEVTVVRTHEVFGFELGSVSNSSNVSVHRLRTLNATRVDNSSTVNVDGALDGPANESVNVSLSLVGPDGTVVTNATRTVSVGSNRTFETNVSAPAGETTPGVYTVEATVDNDTRTDTAQFGRVDGIAVTDVNRDPDSFSLRANTTAMPSSRFVAGVLVTRNGTTAVDSTTRFNRNGTRQFVVTVPIENGIDDGRYNVSVTFGGDSVSDTYEVNTASQSENETASSGGSSGGGSGQ
ncbi:hypothetical protein [Haloarcula litorea]|uniref:hypothetical protein n=1 Tax=Haloarcula litorea TaxID=3032579 RepID=UPI0023E89A7B|nr:hypothetical protein [Halomicroarcula sp. GDY20]